jgi:glyoxylase I family protein
MPARFHHFAVEVSDADRSAEFYCSLLGFEKVSEFAFPDRGRKIVFVKLGEACVELLQGPDPEAAAPQPKMMGWKHLCLHTDDVDREIERLRAAGVKITLEPFDTEIGSRIAFFEDPDGIPLEFWSDSPTGTQ